MLVKIIYFSCADLYHL